MRNLLYRGKIVNGLSLFTLSEAPIKSESLITMHKTLLNSGQHPKRALKPHPIMKKSIPEQFEALLAKECYGEVVKLGSGMEDGEFFRCLCPLITTLDHYKGLFKRLKHRAMSKGFLTHGNMAFVKEAITEFPEERSGYYIDSDVIRSVIVLFLNEDRHDRVVGILEAVAARFAEMDEQRRQAGSDTIFELFVSKFFEQLAPEKDGLPLKRFLTLHGEELKERHHIIFGTICSKLVAYLRDRLFDPLARRLLVDLIGQRSLLTTSAFVKGFLIEDYYRLQIDFIIYSWREAIREGLKDEEYSGGGEDLWIRMVNIFPEQFSGGFPHSEEALEVVLEKFPTKQQLEEAWTSENAPVLLKALDGHVTGRLPEVPLTIPSEPAITWTAFASDSLQECLVSPTKRHVFGRLKALIDDKQYLEVARLGNTLTENEVLEHFCLLMTTLECCRDLFWYLIHRNIHAQFLLRTEMRLVRGIITEAKEEDFEGRIRWRHMVDAIILALTENHLDRVIDILDLVQEVYAEEDEERRQVGKMPKLERFIDHVIERLVPKEYNMLVERFLTFLRGLQENHLVMFETICRSLVYHLRNELEDPDAERRLIDLMRQSSLLTAAAFAEAFLGYGSNDNTPLSNFVAYGWREAIANGLESSYAFGGGRLWNQLLSKFPGEFPEDYPPSEKIYGAVLGRFKTKEQLEEILTRNRDEETVADEFPLVPFNIVSEYAIKWITFLPGSSRKQLTPQASEKISVELKRLFDEGKYGEMARIGNNMKDVDFSRYICPLITTCGRGIL